MQENFLSLQNIYNEEKKAKRRNIYWAKNLTCVQHAGKRDLEEHLVFLPHALSFYQPGKTAKEILNKSYNNVETLQWKLNKCLNIIWRDTWNIGGILFAKGKGNNIKKGKEEETRAKVYVIICLLFGLTNFTAISTTILHHRLTRVVLRVKFEYGNFRSGALIVEWIHSIMSCYSYQRYLWAKRESKKETWAPSLKLEL